MMNGSIREYVVFSGKTLAGSANVTSGALEMEGITGELGLQVTTSGTSSVVKVEVLVANRNVAAQFVVPDGVSDVVTAHAEGTGFYVVDIPVAKYVKFKVTETAGNNVDSLTMILAAQ